MTQEKTNPKTITPKLTIVLVIAALFLGVIVAKAATGGTPAAAPGQTGQAPAGTSAGTITSTRNDAVADYEAALTTGKPIYVLFHSLTCQPCVDISAVADEVLPGYEGKVVFVNAISDDPSGQQLASKFSFQYIPTSFFLAPDGTVVDSFTGAMDAVAMRGYLDKLATE